jgi:hypothetical protein
MPVIPCSHRPATEVSPPPTVDWMARVHRPPINTDILAEAMQFDEPLRAVMTLLTQALKRTKPELIDVAMMRLDVIADRRRGDGATLQAIFAKRMLEQLVLPDPGPASRGVPLVPLRWLAANARSSTHQDDVNAAQKITRVRSQYRAEAAGPCARDRANGAGRQPGQAPTCRRRGRDGREMVLVGPSLGRQGVV